MVDDDDEEEDEDEEEVESFMIISGTNTAVDALVEEEDVGTDEIEGLFPPFPLTKGTMGILTLLTFVTIEKSCPSAVL